VHTQLSDGTEVFVRPIAADDKALLAWGHDHLSAASVHARYLVAKPHLSAAELRYLTEIDGIDHFALVAVMADDHSQLAGVARFIRLTDEREIAEVAIVVGDDLQRRGLGKQLGLMLADAARERGIMRFSAIMLSENTAAHRIFQAISQRLESEHHDGVRELIAELGPTRLAA
jgi:GNAT superfamily N-acetyltransferase